MPGNFLKTGRSCRSPFFSVLGRSWRQYANQSWQKKGWTAVPGGQRSFSWVRYQELLKGGGQSSFSLLPALQ